MTTTDPFVMQMIPIDDIWVNQKNPRAKKTERGDIDGLAQSIETHGLLHPVTVRLITDRIEEGGRQQWSLLAGHRRVSAFKKLKRAEIPAFVLDLHGGTGSDITLIENHHREDPDPVMESDVVCELLERHKGSLEEVSAALGKSKSWVQRRANLRNLSPRARAARASGELIEDWPTVWLEELAILEHERQDLIVESQKERWSKIGTITALRQVVRESLETLASAPWKLDDAEIGAPAPACTACPKNSASQSSLFGDETKPDQLKNARCFDRACFDTKKKNWTVAAVERAQKKHGDKLLLMHGPPAPGARNNMQLDVHAEEVLNEMRDSEGGDESEEKKTPALNYWNVNEAKKADKGAVPALVIDGVGAGTIKYVKPTNNYQPRGRGVDGKPKGPKSMNEKRAQLDARRARHVITFVGQKMLDEGKTSMIIDDDHLVRMVGTWGCDMTMHAAGRSHANSYDAKTDGATRRLAVLEGVMLCMKRVLGERDWEVKGREKEALAEANLVCRALGLDFNTYVAASESEIPEPKSWAKETATVKRAPIKKKKPAKKKASK